MTSGSVAQACLFAAALLWPAAATADGQDWSDFNGNVMGQKYSTASQITPAISITAATRRNAMFICQ